jgi:effector-binding domain-containing protein
MSDQVELKQCVVQPLAVVRRQAKQSELSRVVPELCGTVWEFLRAHDIIPRGRHVAVYYDHVINLEVGVELMGPIQGDGHVVASATPAGPAATATHRGPYSRLHEAYEAIAAWCKQHGRTPAGVYWEVYGHRPDDRSQPETEVYCLLKPIA